MLQLYRTLFFNLFHGVAFVVALILNYIKVYKIKGSRYGKIFRDPLPSAVCNLYFFILQIWNPYIIFTYFQVSAKGILKIVVFLYRLRRETS